MFWRLKRLVDWIQSKVERICPHPSLRYVGDAWDTEWRCRWCEKKWFNEIPYLRRRVYYQGHWYVLDGEGSARRED